MIRDGSGAAVGQYALADSDSDADVDSNDSRRAVEVKVKDVVAGPDFDSDAMPTSWLRVLVLDLVLDLNLD